MKPLTPERRDGKAGAAPRLRFDSREWSGAFGDLGTLVPFLLAYVTVVGVAPAGMLLGFGLALVAAGCYFGTPMAVQPMKAIGAVSIAGAALATGLIWLVLGATGTAARVLRWIGRPVIIGITLGLGFAFMLQGKQLMAVAPVFAAPLLLLTILLLARKAIFAMVLILASGMAWALLADVGMAAALAATKPGFVAPQWTFGALSWEAVFTGIVLLALPQVPLTLGNAVLAPVEFSESLAVLLRLFPEPALGVMLFLAGLQLALGSCEFERDKGERFVTLCTVALAVWNVGIAFLFCIFMLHIVRRGGLRL